MRSNQPRAIALALAIAATGCARAAQPAQGPAPSPTTATPPASATTTTGSRIRQPFTDADVRFMSEMIPHHAQAMVMARLVPSRTESQSIRTLAGRIVNAQGDEIALMQRWLRDRNKPVPQPDTTNAHAGHGASHGAGHGAHAMPGMLSHAQMQQLEAARGREFDRLFLTFMIQHHRGAVEMVKQLLASTGAAQDDMVFKLQADINVDQITEIARMQQMLADFVFDAK